MECNTMLFDRNYQCFEGTYCLQLHHSIIINYSTLRWKQLVPLEQWKLSITLHDIISQKQQSSHISSKRPLHACSVASTNGLGSVHFVVTVRILLVQCSFFLAVKRNEPKGNFLSPFNKTVEMPTI
jgi:hypothetical protein